MPRLIAEAAAIKVEAEPRLKRDSGNERDLGGNSNVAAIVAASVDLNLNTRSSPSNQNGNHHKRKRKKRGAKAAAAAAAAAAEAASAAAAAAEAAAKAAAAAAAAAEDDDGDDDEEEEEEHIVVDDGDDNDNETGKKSESDHRKKKKQKNSSNRSQSSITRQTKDAHDAEESLTRGADIIKDNIPSRTSTFKTDEQYVIDLTIAECECSTSTTPGAGSLKSETSTSAEPAALSSSNPSHDKNNKEKPHLAVGTTSRQERIYSQWPSYDYHAIPKDFLFGYQETTNEFLAKKQEIATKTVRCLKKRRRFFIEGNIDEDPIMKQLEHFILHLPCNEVFDLPFQMYKGSLKFAWCPCGPQMRAWREQCHIDESFVSNNHSYGFCCSQQMNSKKLLKHVRQVAGHMKLQQQKRHKQQSNEYDYEYDDEEHVGGWIHLGIQHYLENIHRDCYRVYKTKWLALKKATDNTNDSQIHNEE